MPSALTLWPKPQIPVCVTTSLLPVNFSVIWHSSSAPSGLQIAVLIVAMPLPSPCVRHWALGRFLFVDARKFYPRRYLPKGQVLNSPLLVFDVPLT
ncbi:MAG: hypothetical protein DMF32_03520 [Verrucomicrobia bacterium]|nr:MAG: hypothetical protein DMF32_03520 [Verrucomicrobiota bacterium]